MEVHVAEVPWGTHGPALQDVRRRVFIEEQNVPQSLEWDGQDDTAVHFIALNEAGQAVGTARLLPSGQIGRMAVLPERRGEGIGRRLLDLAVDAARRDGFARVFLHAQTHATDFYRGAGFRATGDEFMEAGIPHVEMEMVPDVPYEPPALDPGVRAVPSRVADGEPRAFARDGWLFEDTDACRAVLLRVVGLGQRHMQIYSPQLDYQLFDTPAAVDAVSAFARGHAASSVQILIHSSSRIVSRGHRLVELARRLPSHIAIRKVAPDYADEPKSWIVVDDRCVWVLPDHREHVGFANGYDPVEAQRLRGAFDRVWERSREDVELRSLRL